MKFSKVIGKIDEKLVAQAEDKLSQIFIELGARYDNEYVGSGFGGDALIFTLMYPIEHICTQNIPTAATDGKRFYWNPKFVLKNSKLGLRFICGHEAWHALYMHPQRRGSRIPKLWNIAVDYIVNSMVMDDIKARKKDPVKLFTEHLGKYMTLDKYCEFLKDPFKKPAGFEDMDPNGSSTKKVELPSIMDDRELTDEEIEELEKREKRVAFFFADPDLTEEMRRPEKIYEILYNLLPKCPKCGSVGLYKKPQKGKDKNKNKSNKSDKGDKGNKGDKQEQQNGSGKDQQNNHNHGDGNPCDCNDDCQQGDKGDKDSGKGCCSECGDGVDVFDFGGLVDEHLDTEESEEKLAKRISDAVESARKMAGHVPAALEDELGKLTAPKVTWQDVIRTRLVKARSGNAKNDWTRFRSRPMFSGLLVPKRKSNVATFGCLLDTSGSMSKDDMAFGISQLASLDERAEGTITPCDSEIYWSESTKIKKCNVEELSKVKVLGRGGTCFADFFKDYKKNIGECDFLIMITDGYLLDYDIAEMQNPGVDVYWLITSACDFKAPFGKVMQLR